MRFQRQNTAAKWARYALKCGLLLTDMKMWAAVTKQLRDHAEDVGDEARHRYEEQTDRLQQAGRALQGRSNWVTPTLNFLGGIGLGLGLGMLFAPVSGEEARTAIREKVVGFKNKVGDVAGQYRNAIKAEATGTSGD